MYSVCAFIPAIEPSSTSQFMTCPIYTHPMPAGATTSASNTAQADACLDLALDQMAAGDPQGAMAHLQRALALDPHHPAATHALLRALEDTGRLDEALALTRQCIAADPDRPRPHAPLHTPATTGRYPCRRSRCRTRENPRLETSAQVGNLNRFCSLLDFLRRRPTRPHPR